MKAIILFTMLAAASTQAAELHEYSCSEIRGNSKVDLQVEGNQMIWRSLSDSATGKGVLSAKNTRTMKYQISNFFKSDKSFYQVSLPVSVFEGKEKIQARFQFSDNKKITESTRYSCKRNQVLEPLAILGSVTCTMSSAKKAISGTMALGDDEAYADTTDTVDGDLSFNMTPRSECTTKSCIVDVIIDSQKAEDEIGGTQFDVKKASQDGQIVHSEIVKIDGHKPVKFSCNYSVNKVK